MKKRSARLSEDNEKWSLGDTRKLDDGLKTIPDSEYAMKLQVLLWMRRILLGCGLRTLLSQERGLNRRKAPAVKVGG